MKENEQAKIINIKIEKILIDKNIRDDDIEIDDLAMSIEEYGLLQPIIVKEHSDRYIIIAGHRRLRAIKKLQWKEIPAVVESPVNVSSIQLAENLQRKNLSMIEESECVYNISQQLKVSRNRLAKIIGKNDNWVDKRLSFYELRKHLLLSGIIQNNLINKMTFDIAKIVTKYEKKYWIQMCAYLLGKRWYPEKIKEYCECVINPSYKPKKMNINVKTVNFSEDYEFSIIKDDHECIIKIMCVDKKGYKNVLTILQQIGGEII